MTDSTNEMWARVNAKALAKRQQQREAPRSRHIDSVLNIAKLPLENWISTKALAELTGLNTTSIYDRLYPRADIERRIQGRGRTRFCEWRWKPSDKTGR